MRRHRSRRTTAGPARAAHGVTVEEVGQAPRPAVPGCASRQRREGTRARIASAGMENVQDGPDELFHLPGIMGFLIAAGVQNRLPEGAGEGELDVGCNPVARAGGGGAERSG